MLILIINNNAAHAASVATNDHRSLFEELYHNHQRYFHIDPASSLSEDQQLINQLIERFQTHIAFMETQKSFLEYVVEKKKNTGRPFSEIDPAFSSFPSSSQEDLASQILNQSVHVYASEIKRWSDFLTKLESLHDQEIDFEKTFAEFIELRSSRLENRAAHCKETGRPPSTKQQDFAEVCQYDKIQINFAINSLRIYDEFLYALFPYVSKAGLEEANTQDRLIEKDKGLMDFLMKKITIPLDPDSTLDKISKAFENKKIAGKDRKVLRAEFGDAYRELKEMLAQGEVENVEKASLHKKTKTKTKKKKAKGKAARKSPESVEQNLFEGDDAGIKDDTAISSIGAMPSRVKSRPVPYIKTEVPQGGWSKRDKKRAEETASNNSSNSQTANVEHLDEEGYLYEPVSPINLSHTNYEVLQAILDPDTHSFTISFNQVMRLLEEGLNIKVLRKGGSHAHMDTPGRNKKTLVDLHGGWTDKFNQETLSNLRELMINLGLDKTENITVGNR
ncbi:MAG: hypothetical protein K2W94_09070 [Alphaproteobacteria bacterium]|nr:hypothetical protein [Alphaproteobacteria bacterium]